MPTLHLPQAFMDKVKAIQQTEMIQTLADTVFYLCTLYDITQHDDIAKDEP